MHHCAIVLTYRIVLYSRVTLTTAIDRIKVAHVQPPKTGAPSMIRLPAKLIKSIFALRWIKLAFRQLMNARKYTISYRIHVISCDVNSQQPTFFVLRLCMYVGFVSLVKIFTMLQFYVFSILYSCACSLNDFYIYFVHINVSGRSVLLFNKLTDWCLKQ